MYSSTKWSDNSKFEWNDDGKCETDCKGIWANQEPTRGHNNVCTYLKQGNEQETSYKMRDKKGRFKFPFIVTKE